MTRLESLADAIKKHEGWFPFSRSWRNNNPGNLRGSKLQSGTAGGFATFPNYASGWLALWWDLWCKCTGRTSTKLNGESTLLSLFEVWAPKSDGNDPYAYAIEVGTYLEISIHTKLKWFVEDVGS